MANLTLSIPDDLLLKARIRALEQGTSVNAVVRRHLEAYAGGSRSRERAIEEVLRLAERVDTRSDGRRWTRDELHD